MFSKHLIIKEKNEDKLYLFIDFNYEFSLEFDLKSKKEKAKTLYDKIMQYIKEKNIDFKMGKVYLVVGGLIIGSLFIQNYNYSELKNALEPNYKYVEHTDIFGTDNNENIFIPSITNEHAVKEDNTVIEKTIPPINATNTLPTTKTPTTPNVADITPSNPAPTTEDPTVTSPTISESDTLTDTPSTVTPTPITPPIENTNSEPLTPINPPEEPVITDQMVPVYRYNGIVEQISLEDYIIGVVAGEMPASFNVEALKAQSILARTYTLKKLDKGQTLKDDTSNQVYKDINQLKTLWGKDFETYYNKIKNAVASTKGEYLIYNGNYIEAVYHSTSNGQTEDSIVVWGNSFPYLKSVDSHWDLSASSYLRETAKDFNLLRDIIGIDFDAQTNIEILSRTIGNRVNEIKIDNNIFTGIELRDLLGLRSADFDIKLEEDKAVFITKGYGHGVGMSQYGANGMAKEGYNYKDILEHYYPGTQLKK